MNDIRTFGLGRKHVLVRSHRNKLKMKPMSSQGGGT